jgi:hypothetical protein
MSIGDRQACGRNSDDVVIAKAVNCTVMTCGVRRFTNFVPGSLIKTAEARRNPEK